MGNASSEARLNIKNLRKDYLKSGKLEQYFDGYYDTSKVWDYTKYTLVYISGLKDNHIYSEYEKEILKEIQRGYIKNILELSIHTRKRVLQLRETLNNLYKSLSEPAKFMGMPTDYFLEEVLRHSKRDEHGNIDRKSLENYRYTEISSELDISLLEFSLKGISFKIYETGYDEPIIVKVEIEQL